MEEGVEEWKEEQRCGMEEKGQEESEFIRMSQ